MSKYLGQHFLLNKKKINKIIESLDLKSGDVVFEIGSGKGALTIPLFEQCQKLGCKIIAIEKDKELVENLEFRISAQGGSASGGKNLVRQSANKNIEIIEGDILKILPKISQSSLLNSKSYKIVGNIPYYITGYLLRVIGELENKPSLIILTIQKEVAQRICAIQKVKGKPKMNLLAASVQFWAEPKIIGYIPKKDFQPAPKVDSAIIKLTTYDQQSTINDMKNYYSFIKIIFKQPRKTIFNNLRSATNDQRLLKEKLESIGVKANARPQDLSIEQIKELSKII